MRAADDAGALLQELRAELDSLPDGCSLLGLVDRIELAIDGETAAVAASPSAYAAQLSGLIEKAPGAMFSGALLATIGSPGGCSILDATKVERSQALVMGAVRALTCHLSPREAYGAVHLGRHCDPCHARVVLHWNGTVQVFTRYHNELIAQSLPGLPWVLAPWLN